ncbi:MAG: hypothetical protein AAF193_08070 [Bacteroidota bacterium]
MKYHYLSKLLLPLSVGIVLLGCKKEADEEMSYEEFRQANMGSYSIRYYKEFDVLEDPGPPILDSIFYEGELNAYQDSSFHMDWLPDSSPELFLLHGNGNIEKCGQIIGTLNDGILHLEFDDNICTPGPAGADYLYRFYGEKLD